MQLATFLEQDLSSRKHAVVFFVAEQYPLLFINKLLTRLTRTYALPKTALNLEEIAAADLKAQLSMSFLGQHRLFWLGDCSTLSAKAWASVQAVVKRYPGPHMVVGFCDKELPDMLCITLPPAVDVKTCSLLSTVFADDEAERAILFAKHVLRTTTVLTLDQAVRVAEYGLLAGAGKEAFVDEWLPRVVPAQASLFDLSAALLARDARRFIKQWHAVRLRYPAQFWLAYFSEQLFRAYSYAQAKQGGLDARSLGFRLPFSFVQRDWRQADTAFLCAAHARIAQLDWQLKNGSDELSLDSVVLTLL